MLAVSKANKERILPCSFVISSPIVVFDLVKTQKLCIDYTEHVICCVSQLEDKGSRFGCINDQIRLSRLGSLNTCHSLMGFFNLRTVKIANFAAEKQDENRTI